MEGKMSCALSSLFTAVAINVIIITFIYIFAWRNARHTVEGVKLRLIGMLFAAFASISLLQITGFLVFDELIPKSFDYSFKQFAEEVLIPFGITFTLFLGPLLDKTIDGSIFQPPTQLETQEMFRDFLFGPVIEEFLYRFLLTKLLLQCFTKMSTAFISAILFSLSHAHHHYGMFIQTGTCDWLNFSSHLLTTFLFGFYAEIMFIRTRSVLGLALIHSFCNWVSIPRLGRIMRHFKLFIVTIFGVINAMGLLYFFMDKPFEL